MRDEVRDGGLNGGWTEGAEREGKDEVDGPISGPGLEEGGREGRLEEGGGGKGAMAVSSNCG